MTMYRQLWLAIITTTLLALGGSLLASLLSVRGYVEEQLSIKNTDNANSLALSISQQNPDTTAVDLMVAAIFDSGHYEMVRVADPFGRTLAERRAPESVPDVPAWFVRLLPIHASPGRRASATAGSRWGRFICPVRAVMPIRHYGKAPCRFFFPSCWRASSAAISAA